MSKKPSNADAVASLPAVEKVNLLAQALLREYMHRRGFRQTLAAFDVENPRDALTISSRQLMGDLMRLGKIQERNQRRGAGKDAAAARGAFATFMEMLCSYRIRKRAIRRRPVPPTDAVMESDSSDDEARVAAAAAEHRTALQDAEVAVAREVRDVSSRIATLRQTLDGLRAKEAKLLKKQRRQGRGDASGGAAADANKTPRRDDAMKPAKKKKGTISDPLQAAMDVLEHLPAAGGGHTHASSGGVVGRNWTPCGASSSGQAHVPEIGLGSSTGATLGKAPSFVAGEGFRLMGDRSNAAHKEIPEWEAPTTSSNTTSRRSSAASSNGGAEETSSTSLCDDADDNSPVPSPYRIGKTPYDPAATRPGILRAADGAGGLGHHNSAMRGAGASGAATAGTTGPRKKVVALSNSPTSSVGGGISPSGHDVSSADGSNGSSPTAILPRHGFHASRDGHDSAGGNGSPPSHEKQHQASSRTRRRVTILAD